MKRYLLITDAGAAEVEAKTGLRGHNTPLGVLVEDRDPVIEAMRLGFWLEQVNRALYPQKPRCCPECHGTILHRFGCQIGMT